LLFACRRLLKLHGSLPQNRKCRRWQVYTASKDERGRSWIKKHPSAGVRRRAKRRASALSRCPEQPALAVGIDIGVEGFHVCVPGDASEDVKEWRVWYISYAKTPDWRDKLRRLLDERTGVSELKQKR
jgi:hypothetical protein